MLNSRPSSRLFSPERIRLAAFDLDGTLIGANGLSRQSIAALSLLRKKGIEIAIASGRPQQLIPKKYIEAIGARYIISSNGACLTDNCGNTLFKAALRAQALKTIESWIAPTPFYLLSCGECTYLTPELAVLFANTVPDADIILSQQQDVIVASSPFESARKAEQQILKISVYSPETGDLTPFLEIFRQGNLPVSLVADTFELEITSINVTKAYGLSALCEYLGFSPQHTAAFGDSHNDIEMLHLAGFSVCVGGNPAVACHADFSAVDVENDGVARTIFQLFQ